MVKASTSQYSGNKRSSSKAFSSRHQYRNKYSPLVNLVDTIDDNSEETAINPEEVIQKISPLYIYDIFNYIEFQNKISPLIIDNFNISNKNIFFKLNLSTINDYRTPINFLRKETYL